MLATRVIPCLLMNQGALVKTVNFKSLTYVGDPVNAVRIFNQKEVDEIILIDIAATTDGYGIDFDTLEKVVGECFMPICYGGGVKTIADMRRLFTLGIEKISLSSAALASPDLVRAAADEFGNQAVVVTLDVKKNLFGNYTVRTHQGKHDTKRNPTELAQEMSMAGAGEVLLYSIDRDGTWAGFDLKLIHEVANAISVPLIACGGAGSFEHIRAAVLEGDAAAVAVGSMAVFQAKGMGVLIKFPSRQEQEAIFVTA